MTVKMKKEMMENVMCELNLNLSEIYKLEQHREGELYYMSFCTCWVWYELYTDAEGRILGLNTEPIADRAELESISEQCSRRAA